MFWYLLNFIRYTLGSLILFPAIILNKRVRKRRRFERTFGPQHLLGREHDYWFHVSSEGELEQVFPIIHGLIENPLLTDEFLKKPILLIFTSPSLEKKMEEIQKNHKGIDCMAFPLVNIFPWGKNSIFSLRPPKTFFMVRYDFFPELLSIGQKCEKFILLSASLKNKDKSFKRNHLKKLYYKLIISSFNQVFASGERDRVRISELFCGSIDKHLQAHDFRHGQIIQRQKNQPELRKTHCLDSLEELLKPFSLNERFIFGSIWSNELTIFNEDFIEALLKKEVMIFLAPHKLSGEEWEKFENFILMLKEKGIEATLWDHLGIRGSGNVILCQRPGLLCELYPFFGHSFVGGGHGRSVHSLLEPFWGGGHIYCGPKTHRSTEYDFVDDHSPRHLHIVRELPGLYSNYQLNLEIALDEGARSKSAELVKLNQAKFIEHFSPSGKRP